MTALAKLPELPEPEGSMKWTRSAGVCINPEPGYTADQMHEYALAALSPAELGGVELTTSFIQEVPDRCDRIIWRGHYYHLPVNSASTPRAAEAISLVDIGLCNWAAHILSDPERFNTRANDASAAIRRLVAALAPPSAKGE